MSTKKVGYAVLGLGIGMAHADAAYASEYADLVAVCDVDEKRLEKARKKYSGVTAYTDFEELLADGRVDVISICLPSAMHADFAVRAMEAGKHVLVEKPLDITPERAQLIEDARVRTGKICGVVHQNRFNVDMYPIREAVTDGRLGKLILGTFAVKWYRDQRYYDNGGWRGTWEMDGGGSLMNQSVHTVDLMQWLMGDVESVTSHMGIYNHDIKTEDTTVSLIKFKSGAAMAAYHAHVPVQPVAIRVKNRRYRFLRKKTVIIGAPITWEELGFREGEHPDYAKATEIIKERICALDRSYEEAGR